MMTDEEARTYTPRVAIMDENNKIKQLIAEEVHATVL